MTQKQQVFWIIVGGVVAAAIGAVTTNWLSKPDAQNASEIIYTLTSRRLPTAMCEKFRENSYMQPECTLVAINLANPSMEELSPFSVKIDFKSVTYKPLSKTDTVEVSGSGNFISSDLSLRPTTDFQRELTVQRMPRFGTIIITAILGGSYNAEPILIGDRRVQLTNGAEVSHEDDWERLFLAAVAGFLVLPLFAAAAAFFQWLARDASAVSKTENPIAEDKNA